MTANLKYMPVFRLRQEEKKVLTDFNFGDSIFPCIEIIKEVDRLPPKTRNGKMLPQKDPKPFEEVHIPIIKGIKSEKVFIDLPVHMPIKKRVKEEVISFITKMATSRRLRTDYLIKLRSLSSKVIPVLSTYSQRTGEVNSLKHEEKDIRSYYSAIAYRTFPSTFISDFSQILSIAQKQDYIILDLGQEPADPLDEDIIDITDRLQHFSICPIIILRSAISDSVTNVGLRHGRKINDADNHLTETYKSLHGNSFGDYVGIKKDGVYDGGTISPGFIYYDAIRNEYIGFKGSDDKELEDFETIIVPDVIASAATARMQIANLAFLSSDNRGWQTILNINGGRETGKSMAKFKRISMEHYLHCMKTKIEAGDFGP